MKGLHRLPVVGMGLSLMTFAALHAAETGSNRTYLEDVKFLQDHVEVVVLGTQVGGPRVAVVPAYQGRVMTSTAGGMADSSYGWINYAHIASGQSTPHINVYGGEERFWLGPEGGQFSIFFDPGAPFDFAHWQTPAAIDDEAFELVRRSDSSVSFRREARLRNYAEADFHVRVDRTVEILTRDESIKSLGRVLGDVRMVGYRSTNRLTNIGTRDWRKESGLLSIWILGMYKPGSETTVVIPYRRGEHERYGPIVNDAYFGKPPSDRLRIGEGVLYFSGDGQFRSKIGLSPRRAHSVCGSWDAERDVLTIVKFNKPALQVTDYVNSTWAIQEEPYGGDVINSYNDGPPEPGAKPLGPFYELETSSPALALAAGETAEHIQETFHFEGSRDALNALARTVLKAPLEEIESALK